MKMQGYKLVKKYSKQLNFNQQITKRFEILKQLSLIIGK